MKKLIFLFALMIILFSCEDYNDQFEGYDENVITQVENIEYRITEDDYAEMGGDPKKYSSFSKYAPPADYLPQFLKSKYPALDKGSALQVTYDFYRGGLDYLDYLTDSKSYELSTEDYDSMGEDSNEPGKYNNFSSSTPPSDYLPAFFAAKYSDAENGDIVFVTYKYYSGSVSNISEYYGFNGTDWAQITVDLPDGVKVYELTSDDYDEMGTESGQPGRYNNFSSSSPAENYLPAFLKSKYNYAQPKDKVAVVFMYYSGSTYKDAKEYTYDGVVWNEYQSTIIKTDQYLNANSGWVFDPTILYTMGQGDYQIIVDYVKNNIGAEYVSSYGNNELYYGSSDYYANFDVREGKISSTFTNWEEAVIEAIKDGFLSTKFPNAVAQVEGVDVNYIITFLVHSATSDTNYSITFQCTKSGPNPEFVYIEGPI